MRKFIIMFAVMLMTGLSLSACTPKLSDQQIKNDILSLPEFKATTIVDDKTSIVTEKDGDIIHVSANAALAFTKYTVQADITLDYTLSSGKWIVSNQKYTVNQVTPKEVPNLNTIVSVVESMIESDPDSQDIFSAFLRLPRNYELLSSTIDTDPSKVTMVIRSVLTDGAYIETAQFTVECLFNRLTDWSYTLKDWAKEVSMDWSGTYDLILSTEVPGYPGNYLNAFYDIGDKIDGLSIQGKSTLSIRKGANMTVTEDLEASFTFRGIEYHITPVTDGLPNRLFIRLNSNPDYSFYDDSDLIITYYSTLDMPDGSDSAFRLESLSMIGEVTKQP